MTNSSGKYSKFQHQVHQRKCWSWTVRCFQWKITEIKLRAIGKTMGKDNDNLWKQALTGQKTSNKEEICKNIGVTCTSKGEPKKRGKRVNQESSVAWKWQRHTETFGREEKSGAPRNLRIYKGLQSDQPSTNTKIKATLAGSWEEWTWFTGWIRGNLWCHSWRLDPSYCCHQCTGY